MEDNRTERSGRGADILFILALGLLSFAGLCLFSVTTSPLFPYSTGYDSLFFVTVGKGMTKGLLPYRDFFDMKGPYMFLIQYLGQLICYGKTGIFIVQVINLWISLLIVSRVFSLCGINRRGLKFLMLLPIVAICSFTFWGGNRVEEYSLIPLMGCLYVCLAFFKGKLPRKGKEARFFPLAGLLFGASVGYMAYLRVTNAFLVCAMALTVIVYLIREKQANKILPCALGFVGGLLVTMVPPVVYYWSKGLLNEFYKAVVVLGMKYSGELSLTDHVLSLFSAEYPTNYLMLLMMALSVCLVLFMGCEGFYGKLLAVLGTAFTLAAIASGNNYPHYYALALPLIVMGEISFVTAPGMKAHTKKLICGGLALIVLVAGIGYGATHLKGIKKTISSYTNPGRDIVSAQEVSRLVTEDKDKLYVYGFSPVFYLYSDLFPCIKYCQWQDHYIALMPEIAEEMEQIFRDDPPVWLVLRPKLQNLPGFILEAVSEKYELTYSDSGCALYHLAQDK